MGRLIGFAIVGIGVMLIFQHFDSLGLFGDRITTLLEKGQMPEALKYTFGGLGCIFVGLCVAFAGSPK